MKKQKNGQAGLIFIIILILVAVLIIIIISSKSKPIRLQETLNQTNQTIITPDSIKIASWNLQIYGDKKSSNNSLVKEYQDIINDYDLIFLQEIRDEDGTAWTKLCDEEIQKNYFCEISQREGRSNSKEQIGVIYKKDLKVITYITLPDPKDVWERSPTLLTLINNNKIIYVYNAHLKPSDVPNELRELYKEMNTNNKVIVLGDLNADCEYYDRDTDNSFDDWTWLINTDTTTNPNTNCSYDRIIISNEIKPYISNPLVVKTPNHLSDHYLIGLEVKT